MKKILGLAISLMLVMALGTMSFAAAQDPSKPAKPAKSASGDKMTKKAAGKSHQFTGTVSSVAADTVTVKNAKGTTETFTWDNTTTKPADLKEGDRVTVMYKEDGGKKMATAVKAAKASPAKAEGGKKSSKKSSPKM